MMCYKCGTEVLQMPPCSRLRRLWDFIVHDVDTYDLYEDRGHKHTPIRCFEARFRRLENIILASTAQRTRNEFEKQAIEDASLIVRVEQLERGLRALEKKV